MCELSLEFAVWDHDRFSSNELLGLVRLNTGKGKDMTIDLIIIKSMDTIIDLIINLDRTLYGALALRH